MAVGEQHNHTVDTNAQTRSRRQTVFQSRNVVFVIEHCFVIARIFSVNLILETLRLIFRIVQLAETVTDFTSADEEFEAVSDFRVFIITTRQRRNFCRVLVMKVG